MIKMEKIWRIFDIGKVQVEALRGIDLTIKEGEFMAIMGPSGSGKSTLMHIMGCLDTPSKGSYTLDGEKIEDLDDNKLAEIRNEKVGFVFQSFNLLPYASAYENIELPLIFKGVNSSQRKKKVLEVLEQVDLSDRMDHKPSELSGGQQQRVAIARAMVNDPRIIMADEPTGNLDSKSGGAIVELFHKLWEAGKTVIIITHDMSIAGNVERVIKLKDGLVESNGDLS